MTKTRAACGEWKTPIDSEVVAGKTVSLSAPSVVPNGQVYWLEMRPLEQGRVVLATQAGEGAVVTVTPPVDSGVNVRSRVHEYGGGAYVIVADDVYFTNYKDQRIYRQSLADPSAGVIPVTAEDTQLRFADAIWDAPRKRLICVTEDHSGSGEPVNTICAVDVSTGAVAPLAQGSDFYLSPSLDASCSRLAWVQWNLPNMAWDGTELCTAQVSDTGALVDVEVVAGGVEEAAQQPRWGEDGSLYYVSDPTGWWNLYRRTPEGQTEALYPSETELGVVPWTLGRTSYALLPAGRLLVVHHLPSSTAATLAVLDPEGGTMTPLNTGFASFGTSLTCSQLEGSGWLKVAFVAGSPSQSSKVVSVEVADVDQLLVSTPADWHTHQRAMETQIDPSYLSAPESIKFPTADGEVAYMYYYPPTNPEYQPLVGEKPPLLIKSHGGPTSSASTDLNLKIQYFTSRGYAVADVNYRGSTGYGRSFRNLLRGRWGVVDVDDCCNAALHLEGAGRVDAARLCISGGSAGGFTTLAALTFKRVFHAGASYYGVADLEKLAKETHKFESRYLDSMVGPYPEAQEVYRQRSPACHTAQLNCPVVFFQGSDDHVVPPNQAEDMHAALKDKGLATALVMFEGEQHGFSRADSIRCSLDGELYFYGRVLGFNAPFPPDLQPFHIDNLDQ